MRYNTQGFRFGVCKNSFRLGDALAVRKYVDKWIREICIRTGASRRDVGAQSGYLCRLYFDLGLAGCKCNFWLGLTLGWRDVNNQTTGSTTKSTLLASKSETWAAARTNSLDLFSETMRCDDCSTANTLRAQLLVHGLLHSVIRENFQQLHINYHEPCMCGKAKGRGNKWDNSEICIRSAHSPKLRQYIYNGQQRHEKKQILV